MPANPRVRGNNAFGITTDNPLTAGSGSFNSNQLIYLPTVNTQHAVITLDPLRQFGDPEIVVVTAHTAAGTVATITRGQYGTLARSHPIGTVWAHAAIDEDFTSIVTSATRPTNPYEGEEIYESDTHRPVRRDNTQWLPQGANSIVTSLTRPANPYEGQEIYESDTDRKLSYNGTAWLQNGLYFDPPACIISNNASQSIAHGSVTTLGFNTESIDTDTMHDNAINNSRITIRTAGIYRIEAHGELEAATNYVQIKALLGLNGVSVSIGSDVGALNTSGTGAGWAVNAQYKLAVNDFLTIQIFQVNGSGSAKNAVSNTIGPVFSAIWTGRGN